MIQWVVRVREALVFSGDSRMSKTYRPWNPDQNWLLPPSPRDWVPEGDLTYFLLDVVQTLDLSPILRKYEAEGRGDPPFHPRMMVALLLYAYCRGVFSSRRIMQACEERVTFRVIVGEDIPDFRTISDFRKLHLKELAGVFFLGGRGWGGGGLGGGEARSDEWPAELARRETRLAKIQEARKALEKQALEAAQAEEARRQAEDDARHAAGGTVRARRPVDAA